MKLMLERAEGEDEVTQKIAGGREATEFEEYWYSFMKNDLMTGPHLYGSYASAEAAYNAGKSAALAELRAKASAAVAVPVEIEDYLSSYEWRAEDNGVFELTNRDRELLRDFVNGLPLYTAPPAQAVSVPDVDWLANVIREADGKNSLGAGQLAEKIVQAMEQPK